MRVFIGGLLAVLVFLAAPASVAAQTVREVPAPQNLRASVVGSTVLLNWTKPDVTRTVAFGIEVGSAPGLRDYLVVVLIGTNFSSVRFNEAPLGKYYVQVRAIGRDYDESGYSLISAPTNSVEVLVRSQEVCSAPGAVNGLQALTLAPGAANLSWYPVPGAEYYSVHVTLPDGRYQYLRTVEPRLDAVQVPAGNYTVRVVASNACDEGPMSLPVIVTVR